MDERAWLARYLALAVIVFGGLEWLLGRVVSRLAAAPPISGVGRTIIEILGRTGFFLLSTAFLLALALMLVSAMRFGDVAYRKRYGPDAALSFYLAVFGIVCLANTVLALLSYSQESWLTPAFNVLSALAIWWLALRFMLRPRSWPARLGVLLVALAYSGWFWSIVFPQYATTEALQFGELLAVLAPIAFFAAIVLPGGLWRRPARWIAPLIVGVLFAAGNTADIIFDQGFTGVFSIWSVGFTLYLPWPLYALSMILFLYTVLTCFARRKRRTKGEVVRGADAQSDAPNEVITQDNPGFRPEDPKREQRERRYGDASVGMGLLMLPFAGYYLQLTYQHLLAVLALMLITRVARPFAVPRTEQVPLAEVAEQATT